MRAVILALLATAVSAAFFQECDRHFLEFKTKHQVRYADDAEHAKRRDIFCERMKEVDELNAKGNNNVFGITKFSAHTREEFAALLG